MTLRICKKESAKYTAINVLQAVNTMITNKIYIPTGATTHYGFVFCSPLAGYSLLACEVF